MTFGSNNKVACPAGRGAGFTMIELLVVIAILALLISIVLPAYSHVKEQAYSASTMSWIRQLEAGCEQYYQDNRFYPGQNRIALLNAGTGNITGSRLLTASLFGFSVNESTGAMTRLAVGQYEEYAAFKSEYLNSSNDVLDRFSEPLPLLYFPARVGRTGKSIYQVADNKAWYDAKTIPDFNDNDQYDDPQDYDGAFWDKIEDKRLSGIVRPYRPDSYLLIGAGIDRKYFTDDDEVNFNK